MKNERMFNCRSWFPQKRRKKVSDLAHRMFAWVSKLMIQKNCLNTLEFGNETEIQLSNHVELQ